MQERLTNIDHEIKFSRRKTQVFSFFKIFRKDLLSEKKEKQRKVILFHIG